MKNLLYLMKYSSILGITAILISSCMSPTKSFKLYADKQSYDAIIVPGVPFENGVWSDIMKIRVHWAVYLYKKGIAKNIVFSGSSVYSPYVESKIMALYAEELGVAQYNIFTEERAEHSSENLYYSYKIAQKNGFKKIALATDPFQGAFLKGFANKILLEDIGFLPIVFDTLKTLEMNTPIINPESAYISDFVSIVERENASKRFQGTMGKFIKYAPGDNPKDRQKNKNTSK